MNVSKSFICSLLILQQPVFYERFDECYPIHKLLLTRPRWHLHSWMVWLSICLPKDWRPSQSLEQNKETMILPWTVFNDCKNSNLETWKKSNEPLKVPPDRTDKFSTQNWGEKDKRNTVCLLGPENKIVNTTMWRKT